MDGNTDWTDFADGTDLCSRFGLHGEQARIVSIRWVGRGDSFFSFLRCEVYQDAADRNRHEVIPRFAGLY